MEQSTPPRYAQHRIDGYTFYLDREQDELSIELSRAPVQRKPAVLRLTFTDARALRAFLTQPDVAAVLLAADLDDQEDHKRFHDDPTNR